MGILAIISDLHADINHFSEAELSLLAAVLRKQQVTSLHLAGDVANKFQRCLEIVGFFEEQGFLTTFNFGNHEMPSLTGEAAIEDCSDPRFLNFRTRPLNQELVLLGINGWYDYSFAVSEEEQALRSLKRRYWYDRSIARTGSDPEVMARILKKTEQVLQDLAAADKKVVLATHFVPKKEFIVYQTGRYQIWNRLNAFLGSAAFGELLDRQKHVQQVVFGHTHRRFADQDINGTRYSCRPLGYYYEWQLTREFVRQENLPTRYEPPKLRSFLKKNDERFAAFRLQHLAAEFLQGMTLIAY